MISPRKQSSIDSVIIQRAEDTISDYLSVRIKSPYKSWKKAIPEIAHEYGHRFLIELIQNGYDAHPRRTRNGKIRIDFYRHEGSHGALYVGNTGNPFNEKDLHRICEIFQSDKKPGQGIGYKGVGFRSVLMISDSPEIYSAQHRALKQPQFSGFCFRFATPDDISSLTRNKEHCKEVLEGISRYSLPFPLRSQNDVITSFAQKGYATVIRLPLKGDKAIEIVETELESLCSSEAPIMLFLDRIKQLAINIYGSVSEARSTALMRHERILSGPLAPNGNNKAKATTVDLGDQGRFLVAHHSLPVQDLQKGLRDSVEQGFIEAEWAEEWEGIADISIAVRLDVPSDQNRLFAFLPMGEEARAPFSGYINAPFYTRLNRMSINEEIPLNSLFLDSAAELCAKIILRLRYSDQEWAPSAITDLLAWRQPFHNRIKKGFSSLGENVIETEVIPIVPYRKRSWGRLGETYRWDDQDYLLIKNEFLVQCMQVSLISPTIGKARIEHLDDLKLALTDQNMDPDSELIACWVESAAEFLSRKKFQPRKWDNYYSDISNYFRYDPKLLYGRNIIIDDSAKLRRAGDPSSTDAGMSLLVVFFSPQREMYEDEDSLTTEAEVKIPAMLRRYIAYTHPKLSWYESDRSQTHSRRFLRDHKLVQPFGRRTVLLHVNRALAGTRSDRVRMEALKWTYRLFRAIESDQQIQWHRLNLYLPARSGWIPASSTSFSKDWQGTKGTLFEEIIHETRGISIELSEIESQLLLPPKEWPFKLESVNDWASFLRRCGVRDGLYPLTLGKKNIKRQHGSQFRPGNISEMLNLSQEEEDHWKRAVQEFGSYPRLEGPYEVEGFFFRIPGQNDFNSFSDHAKELYASLILHGLGYWPRNCLTAKIHRPSYTRNKDPHSWPTPAFAFLKYTEWVPAKIPGVQELRYLSVSDSWHFSKDDTEIPRFAPLIPFKLRMLINQEQLPFNRLEQMKELGIRLWEDPTHAPDLLLYLNALFVTGGISETYISEFKDAYRRVWINIIDHNRDNPFGTDGPSDILIVSMRGGLQAIDLRSADDEDDVPIYIRDRDDVLADHIIKSMGWPIFDIGKRYGKAVIDILKESSKRQIELTSEMKMEVVIDGQPYTPSSVDDYLISGNREWLIDFIALNLEFRSGAFTHLGIQGILKKTDLLRRIHIRFCKQLSLLINGKSVDFERSNVPTISIWDEDHPTILIIDQETNLNIRILGMIARNLAEFLEQPQLTYSLRSSFMDLDTIVGSDNSLTSITDQQYLELFQQDQVALDDIKELRLGIRSAVARLLNFLYPIIYHFVGFDAASTLDIETTTVTSETELIEVLTHLCELLPVAPKKLLDIVRRASDLSEIRDELKIDYGDFNRSLSELRPLYSPIHNPDGHKQALAYFKQQHRREIFASIRSIFLDGFKSYQVDDEYLAHRILENLKEDRNWLDVCHLPTDVMMESHINTWLHSVGAPEMSDEDSQLLGIDEVRKYNHGIITTESETLSALISTWCDKQRIEIPFLWTNADDIQEELYHSLYEKGAVDFLPLELSHICQWLRNLGHWPGRMPVNIDPESLNLTQKEIDDFVSKQQNKKDQKQLERLSISIEGEQIHAVPQNYQSLIQKVMACLDESFLKNPIQFAHLEPQDERRKTDGGSGGLGGSRTDLSDTQKKAIGFIGEYLAFQWLQERYKNFFTSDCWKSGYRRHVFPGKDGDDSLGYDFEIVRKRDSLLFEVKTISTDTCEFILTESEVICAQSHAGGDAYRILVILKPLERSRKLVMLRNPFSKKGQGHYRLIGKGMKYRFQLAT